MPVATYMTATEPLGENRAKALLPTNLAIGDANFVLNYFRRSSDHRMLFGGGVSYTAAMPPSLPAQMRRMMLRIFPQLGITNNVYNGRVSVRVIGGTGRVAAYGSVVDNRTVDPTYVPSQ